MKLLDGSPTGAQLRALREAAGLTQTQAAELIGARLRTLQDWESDTAAMHAGLWALLRLVLDRHPRARLSPGRR